MQQESEKKRNHRTGSKPVEDLIDTYGVLVGWKSQDLHDRIILRVQSVRKPPPHTEDDVHHSVYMLDKNQAVQLGHYLFQVSGQTKPSARPGLLARLFGR